MIDFLISRFIKETDSPDDLKVRDKAGSLSSAVGIICNILLFILKFTMGTLSHSVAIVSDAFNNLSDLLSCIVTLGAYKLAARPADNEHPFGHGRMEYLSSLVIAAVIVMVGFEFLKTSVNRLLHPEPVVFKGIVVASLIVSIAVKCWMYLFNKKLGTKMNSSTMLATAQDSLSDCITTFVAMMSLVLSLVTTFPIDGVAGILVSFVIMKSGYGIIRDTVDVLVGQPADQETVDKILNVVLSHEEILGVHDIIVHNYGPGKMMASLHAEVDADSNIIWAHEIIDYIEREISEKLHIMMVIHMDPLEVNNVKLSGYKERVNKVIDEMGDGISYHDFRMVEKSYEIAIIFDIVLPYNYKFTKKEINDKFVELFKNDEIPVACKITFDTQF